MSRLCHNQHIMAAAIAPGSHSHVLDLVQMLAPSRAQQALPAKPRGMIRALIVWVSPLLRTRLFLMPTWILLRLVWLMLGAGRGWGREGKAVWGREGLQKYLCCNCATGGLRLSHESEKVW